MAIILPRDVSFGGSGAAQAIDQLGSSIAQGLRERRAAEERELVRQQSSEERQRLAQQEQVFRMGQAENAQQARFDLLKEKQKIDAAQKQEQANALRDVIKGSPLSPEVKTMLEGLAVSGTPAGQITQLLGRALTPGVQPIGRGQVAITRFGEEPVITGVPEGRVDTSKADKRALSLLSQIEKSVRKKTVSERDRFVQPSDTELLREDITTNRGIERELESLAKRGNKDAARSLEIFKERQESATLPLEEREAETAPAVAEAASGATDIKSLFQSLLQE